MIERILLIAILLSSSVCAMEGIEAGSTADPNLKITYDQTKLIDFETEEHDLLRASPYGEWSMEEDQRKNARINSSLKYVFGSLCAMYVYPHVPCDSSDSSLLFLTVAGNLAVFALVSNVKQLIDAKTMFSKQPFFVYDFCEKYAGGFFITLLVYSTASFPHSNDCFLPNYLTVASNLLVCALACYAADVLLNTINLSHT